MTYAEGEWHYPEIAELEIPQSVRVAIQSRVSVLPGSTQDTLRLAAIFGREFEYKTLAKVSELAEDALIDALESAERAQLIRLVSESRDVTFSFSHVLIPSTLYESVSALRRQRMHRQIAVALEDLRPDDFEALAHHFAAAGEYGHALNYYHQAARRAVAMYAYEQAIEHLQNALDLIDVGDAPETRLLLLEELADANRHGGERVKAISHYQEALLEWRKLADADKWTVIWLHRKIGITFTDLYSFIDRQNFEQVTRVCLEDGLRLTEGLPPHTETVRLLRTASTHAYLFRTDPDWEAAGRYAEAAVDMAERLDEPVELSMALGALAPVFGAQGRFRERVEVCLRRIALTEDAHFDSPRERVDGLHAAGIAQMAVGEYESALLHLQQAEALASKIQDVEKSAYALGEQGVCLFRLDRWDELLKTEETWRALKQHYPPERSGWLCVYIGYSASVHALRGDGDKASEMQEESRAIMLDATGPQEEWGRNQHY